ncbi:LysR family transcriptional regulator [Vibrio mediterranei]
MISPELLRSFIAAADAGSFSAAGRILGRHQATISGNIARLEDELAVILFDREGKYPSITEAGLALYDSAKLVVESSDRFERNALNLSSGIPAKINIALDADLPVEPFTRAIGRLRENYPLLKVNLMRKSPLSIFELVKDESVDMGVTPALEGRSNAYEFSTIGTVSYKFVCGAKHPFAKKAQKISTDELMHHTQLISHSVLGTPREEAAKLSYDVWEVEGYETMLSVLKENIGWAFVPSMNEQPLLERIRFFEAEYVNSELTALYDVIWPKNRALSQVEEFLKHEFALIMRR